jgi:hypothetical protein
MWRSNKTAWITHYIIKEYLRWFDNRMVVAGKKAFLLMDNFSAHELGVEQIEEAGELRPIKVAGFILNVFFAFLTNLRIQIKWIPPNATSEY